MVNLSNGAALTVPEDVLTCLICQEEYDLDVHIPKMLDFCHHTICIVCLKKCNRGGVIACPNKCEKPTKLEQGRDVDKLTTNFYILPMVEKRVAAKKLIEELTVKVQNNWAEAINVRREPLGSSMRSVHEAIRLLENQISQNIEQNNETIAILQSLLEEEPECVSKIPSQSALEDAEAQVKSSEETLIEAKRASDDLVDVENYICHITLTDPKEGVQYVMKNTTMMLVDLSNHGTKVGASMVLLTYILSQFKAAHLWEKLTNNGPKPIVITEDGPSLVAESQEWEEEAVALPPNCVGSPTSMLGPSADRQVFLQISVNGMVKPTVVIDLMPQEAPIMCSAFMRFILGTDLLSYESSPLSQAKPGEFLYFGDFSQLKRLSTDRSAREQLRERHHRYMADQSSLEERRGAVRMRFRERSEYGVTCCSEFSIVLSDRPCHYPMTTVFGYVSRGMATLDELSRLLIAPPNRIIIKSCGLWMN